MIDFHRLAFRGFWRRRDSQVKDLAQLLYSTFEVSGITARDRVRFWKLYRGGWDASPVAQWVKAAAAAKARRYASHNAQAGGGGGVSEMDIALCYESVLPSRGGAETYIGDLARRLARDGHAVHLYASRWDAAALPASTHFHRLEVPNGPRFLRPWRFAGAVRAGSGQARHDVSIGFDKTWGQDVLYPQGGLHAASRFHNLLKYRVPGGPVRGRGRQAVRPGGPFVRPAGTQAIPRRRRSRVIVVNSRMVRRHFEQFHGIGPESVRVVHSAIDPLRFAAEDRLERRQEERDRWGVAPDEPVGLFVAMNYRLKGLALLHPGRGRGAARRAFRLAVVGHPKFARVRAAGPPARGRRPVPVPRLPGRPEGRLLRGRLPGPPDVLRPVLAGRAGSAGVRAAGDHDPVQRGERVADRPGQRRSWSTTRTTPGRSAAAISRMLDPAYRRSASQSARQAAGRWTFEHHYRALLDVFAEVRAAKRAA